MRINTLLREAEHRALREIILDGTVLDLGGDSYSEYRNIFKGVHQFETVNVDAKSNPTIFHNLETCLPTEDKSYDNVILINVLEHIYEYRQLLSEAVRSVRPGGSIVIVVPFLFPIHPSPQDFWRFSKETLQRECEVVGLSNIQIIPLGTGVFASLYVLLDRLLPAPVRLVSFYIIRPIIQRMDSVFTRVARATNRSYDPGDYPLGYCVTAKI